MSRGGPSPFCDSWGYNGVFHIKRNTISFPIECYVSTEYLARIKKKYEYICDFFSLLFFEYRYLAYYLYHGYQILDTYYHFRCVLNL